MQPEERGATDAHHGRPPESGSSQLAFGEREEGERERDGLDEVEEAEVERRGMEHRRREHGEAPIAAERAQEHPERCRRRHRDQREHDPHGCVRPGDLRDRRRGQVEAEILQPPEIELEPPIEREPRRVIVR